MPIVRIVWLLLRGYSSESCAISTSYVLPHLGQASCFHSFAGDSFPQN